MNRTRPTRFAVPLELGGKRGRRLDVAEAAIRTTEAEIAQVIVETRNAVRRAYFDRAIADARVALLDELQAHRDARARRGAAAVRRRQRTAARGAASRTGAARRRRMNPSARADSRRRARTSSTRCSGLPADAPTVDRAADLDADRHRSRLPCRARDRPARSWRVLDRRLDEQRARIALARALRSPDLTPEGSITHGFAEDGPFQTGWKAALAITLPHLHDAQGRRHARRSDPGATDGGAEAADMRIAAAVAAAVAIADAQRQQFIRYRDEIVPQAHPGGTDGRGRLSARTDRYRRLPPGVAGHTRRPPALRCKPKPICKPRSRTSNRRLERRRSHDIAS